MPTRPSRSSALPAVSRVEEELRLPRPPGVIRQFWARHPLFADILIAALCLLSSAGTSVAAVYVARPVAVGVSVVIGVAVVGSSVLMVWRRRWPVAMLAIAIVVELVLLASTALTGMLLFPVAVYTLAVYRSTRASWVGLGVGVALIGVLSLTLLTSGALTFEDAINSLLSVAVPGLIGALIGVNVGNRRRYMEAVIARSHQLLVERDQHAQLAAAAERDRIAREMHDIVSHSLTVVVALSEGAVATTDQERARSASQAAATTARNALAEMRSMLGVLRDGDTDAPLAPLEATSPAATVAAAQHAGFTASLAVRGHADAPPALRLAIGRIVQEGVTNAMRHAPSTRSIDVRIDYDASPMIIEIVNDGASGAVSEGGFGLRGLTERAELLGGFVVSAPAGQGRWMLRAELPTAPADPATAEEISS